MGAAMSLRYRERPAAGEPEGALVLFHGRGADEDDLFPLLDVLDPERRLAGYTPRAPLSLPPGGAHWYAVPRVGYPDPVTFGETFALASSWLDSLPFAAGRVVLGGFSQGAVMSFAFGAGGGRPRPAGIIGLSGFVPAVDGWALEPENVRGLPVFLAHGTHDPVISVEFAQGARSLLEDAGAELTYRESPVGHQIDPRVLAELPGWLGRVAA
jgi:phospholipase/carboxylesterase